MATKINIATLNVIITGDSGPANAAMGDLVKQQQKAFQALQNMSPVRAGVERDTRKYLQAVNQLSYGLEDFLSVVGTTGFSGAMRGASNNISMAARTLSGPMTGAVIGVGVAIGSILLPKLWEWATAEEDLTEKNKKLIESLEELSEKRLSKVRRQNELPNAETADDVKSIVDRRREELQEVVAAEETANDEIRKLQQQREQAEMQMFERLTKARQKEGGKMFGDVGEIIGEELYTFIGFRGDLNKEGEKTIRALTREIEEMSQKEGVITEELQKQIEKRERLIDEIEEASRKLEELAQKEVEAKARDNVPWDFFADETRALNRQAFTSIFGDVGREFELAMMKLKSFYEKRAEFRKQQTEADKLRADLEVDIIKDTEARKLASINKQLEADQKRINKLKELSQTERDELSALASQRAQVATQEIIAEKQKQLLKEANSRIESKSINPSSRNSTEGSRMINQMINRTLAGGVAKDEAAEAIEKFKNAIKPILEKIQRNTAAGSGAPPTMNLTGGP